MSETWQDWAEDFEGWDVDDLPPDTTGWYKLQTDKQLLQEWYDGSSSEEGITLIPITSATCSLYACRSHSNPPFPYGLTFSIILICIFVYFIIRWRYSDEHNPPPLGSD